MSKNNKKIAILTGDVNGIGAEITIKALNRLALPKDSLVLVSNREVLNFYGKLEISYDVVEIPLGKNDIKPGKITKKSGEFCFKSLKTACEKAKTGEFAAIVTAPVSKEALHLGGHKFNGQTEVLQKFLSREGQRAEMLFVAGDFRVLLLTRHVPLKELKLDKNNVVDTIFNLDDFFKSKLKCKNPCFALCSLNPHAGEGGILGREEIDILQPAVTELRARGVNITNPLPADTLFIHAAKDYVEGQTQTYDCYIACYHDQGLIPIKTLAAEKTVNMTIGLDVIRTSPSHGTAFDIAGKNIADENSMIEAIKLALNN